MELNLKLQSNQINMIFGQAERALMENEMIYYSYRKTLSSIYNQLPKEHVVDFHNDFPLLSDVLSIRY